MAHDLIAVDLVVGQKRRRQRRTRVDRMIAQAERAGKKVTRATMPDGTVLHFGDDAPTSNPWLTEINKVTRQ
jgi:hypothetical protein